MSGMKKATGPNGTGWWCTALNVLSAWPANRPLPHVACYSDAA